MYKSRGSYVIAGRPLWACTICGYVIDSDFVKEHEQRCKDGE